MTAARLLALADDDDRRGQAPIARAFQIFLLMHVAVRTALWALRDHDDAGLRAVLVAMLAGCALLGLSRRWARTAAALALVPLGYKLVDSFPATSNHFVIELLCVALLALCGIESDEERALLLAALRWLTVLVLFWSGMQKLLYGTYFTAQFLGFEIATRPAFAAAFGWLLPAAELARLRGLAVFGVGSGPFAVRAPLVVAIANGVWLFELAAPLLLLVRRTRPYAALAAIAFVLAIEAGARELLFGALFINLLLLFFIRPFNRVLLPAFALLYAALLGVRLRLVPRVHFN